MNVYRHSLWMTKRKYPFITFCPKNSPLWKACVEDSLPVCEYNIDSKLSDVLHVSKLIDDIQKNRSKIVVTHLNPNILATVLAKKLSQNYFTLIYEQHMHIGVDKKDFLHNWLYSNLDLWLTTTPFLKKKVLERTNIFEDKIKLIVRGFEIDRFITNQPDKNKARQKMELPLDATIIGVIGRFDPQKGQHLLLQAAAEIHKKGFPIHILLVGAKTANEETGYYEKLKQMVVDLNLSGFVHFRDFMKQQEYAMAALDIFTMTTNSETYGMVTIESMASERMVIGSNAGGTLDLIQNNVTGLHFETGNAKSLEEKILYCLNNPDKADEMAKKARIHMRDNYSTICQLDAWEKLINGIMSQK